MKKLTLLVTILFSIAQASFAQQDAKAREILDAMSAKYQKMNSFKADIEQKIFSVAQNQQLGSMEIEATVKGDKYRLKIGDQIIYNNTETVWTYMKDIEEVNVSNANNSAESLLSAPSKIYTIYKDGFKYLYMGTKSEDGTTYHVVDLSPNKDIKANFYKLTMYIDTKDNSLTKWEVFEKGNQTRYLFTVKDFKQNVSVTDADFEFSVKANPDVEVVDLR
ncbi:outer membrane lipoprotein carrier protein LolA [Limibacter armeniacum]|uniref:LolA family protein n=1 Tax=Limibacter armeniacum TaxID=466084 RepID=UPI002FE5A16B